MNRLLWTALVGSVVYALFVVSASQAADELRTVRDLEYARVGDMSLKLDLYVPAAAKSPPLVVWVHGGAGAADRKTILRCCR